MCDTLTAVFMRCDRLPDILAQVRYLTLNMEIYWFDIIPSQLLQCVQNKSYFG